MISSQLSSPFRYHPTPSSSVMAAPPTADRGPLYPSLLSAAAVDAGSLEELQSLGSSETERADKSVALQTLYYLNNGHLKLSSAHRAGAEIAIYGCRLASAGPMHSSLALNVKKNALQQYQIIQAGIKTGDITSVVQLSPAQRVIPEKVMEERPVSIDEEKASCPRLYPPNLPLTGVSPHSLQALQAIETSENDAARQFIAEQALASLKAGHLKLSPSHHAGAEIAGYGCWIAGDKQQSAILVLKIKRNALQQYQILEAGLKSDSKISVIKLPPEQQVVAQKRAEYASVSQDPNPPYPSIRSGYNEGSHLVAFSEEAHWQQRPAMGDHVSPPAAPMINASAPDNSPEKFRADIRSVLKQRGLTSVLKSRKILKENGLSISNADLSVIVRELKAEESQRKLHVERAGHMFSGSGAVIRSPYRPIQPLARVTPYPASDSLSHSND